MSITPILNTLRKQRVKFQPSKLRYHINNEIMQLCKNGDITNAMDIYRNKMIQKQIIPNTYTLFALLIGCRESNHFEISQQIWHDLVMQRHIKPDFNCYHIMMHLLSHKRHHQNTENSQITVQLIHSIKQSQSTHNWTPQQWFVLINSLSLLGEIDAMMTQYHRMKSQGVALNPFVLTSLLEGIIKFGYPHALQYIWNDIRHNNHGLLSQMIDCRVLQSFMVGICRMQRYYQFEDHLLCNVWHLIVNQLHIEISTHCFCIAILTFSKYGRNGQEFGIFMDLISNHKMIRDIEIDSVGFRQVLTACGNLSMLDEMWSIYDGAVQCNDETHDVNALNTILNVEDRRHKLKHVLDIVRKCFEYKSLDLYVLIGLCRVADKCEDCEAKNEILKLLKSSGDIGIGMHDNIVACFDLNGKQCIVHNGMNEDCVFDSMKKVDELVEDSGYLFDHSVGNEIPNEKAREMHLKYHAEKKALCVLLNEMTSGARVDTICNVSVSISMCNDCHKFFAEMSKHCNREIHCADPKGLHVFQDGQCLLCA
eukprot:249967_1